MPNQETEIIDWNLVRRRLAGVLDRFAGWYLPAVVFITPLLIVTYGWPAPVIRQLALFILVGLGWLLWLSRALLLKEAIIWQRSALGWGALAVALAALISSFTAYDPIAVWGLRGGLADSSPYAWLAMVGLAVLIAQVAGTPVIPSGAKRSRGIPAVIDETPRQARGDGYHSKRILVGYLLSSSLLALFVTLWWIGNQELITPALGLFSTAALWFSINALVLGAASLLFSGRARLAALILIGLHIVVLFGYDFDLAWYVLAGGGLLLSVGQLLFEKRLPRVDFRLSFGLVVISVILLFVPVKWLSPKLGFDFSAVQTVSAPVAWPRYYDNVLKSDPWFGAGLGGSAESFWNTAELVDMRQMRQFPALGNGYLSILWEGGLALLGAFLFWLFSLGRSLNRLGFKTQPNSALTLVAVLGLAGWLVVFAITPLDFMIIFSLGLFIGLLGAALAGSPIRLNPSGQGTRSFLIFGALLTVVFLSVVLFFSVRAGQGRLDFLGSIKTNATGASVDLAKLERAIAEQAQVFGYRLARVDFYVQALSQASNKPNFKIEQLAGYLAALQDDYNALERAKLTARQAWILAWDAEQAAALLTKEEANKWLSRARGLYEKSLASLPRNVVILTDAARFYRTHSAALLESSEAADALYLKARALLDKAITIDDTYEPAFLERSQLLVVEGKSAEAFDSFKVVVEKNPAAAYEAGHLALAAKKFEEAVAYFKKAIEQNPNHLQARYELIQAYLALADLDSARVELAALEERIPKDDAATQGLLKGLRELLK